VQVVEKRADQPFNLTVRGALRRPSFFQKKTGRNATSAKLTFAEGVRMRIVLIFLVVLVILVLRMPFALRGDETLAGRLQNFLAYSIGTLGVLLSLATVFFSCATLTSEFKQCSLHLVVTKPVSRFQILLGKWLGVNLLNLLIVGLCVASRVERRPASRRSERNGRTCDRESRRRLAGVRAGSALVGEIAVGV
jgi:hypothetical protein